MISLYKVKGIMPENPVFLSAANENKAVILVEMAEEVEANIESMFRRAMSRGEGFYSDFENLRLFHSDWISKHIPFHHQALCQEGAEIYLEKLYTLLSCKTILKDQHPQARDYALAIGEQIAVWLVSQSLDHPVYYAAGKLFKAEGAFGSASLLEKESLENIKQYFPNNSLHCVMPARFGKNRDGCIMLMHPEAQQKAANLFYKVLAKEPQTTVEVAYTNLFTK